MTKNSERRYAESENLRTTTNHPGYSAAYSPAKNVRIGRRYNGGQPFKLVAEQLQEQASLRKHGGRYHKERVKMEGRVFAEAAEMARRMAHERDEYKGDRKKLRA